MRLRLTKEIADGLCDEDPAGLGVGQASVNDSEIINGVLRNTFSEKSTMPTERKRIRRMWQRGCMEERTERNARRVHETERRGE